MRLKSVSAAHGVLWVRSGFRVFFDRPLAFAGLFAAFLFGATVLLLLPVVGPLLLLAALPLVSQGFMLATQRALGGTTPMADVFIEPMRSAKPRVAAMVKLGLLYAGASFFIMWMSGVVDGGAFGELQDALTASTPDQAQIEALLADPRLRDGMLVRLILASVMSIPFWHAPALTHWDGQGPAQALFSSTLACWRNRGAFAVFGVTWAVLITLLALIITTLFTAFDAQALVPMAVLPAGMMFSTVFYASVYFTFTDCFEQAPEPAEMIGSTSA
jgi:hypothetical protein